MGTCAYGFLPFRRQNRQLVVLRQLVRCGVAQGLQQACLQLNKELPTIRITTATLNLSAQAEPSLGPGLESLVRRSPVLVTRMLGFGCVPGGQAVFDIALEHLGEVVVAVELIFVGDATMSPYEVLQPGGSVEYNNEEAGAVWLQRFTSTFPKFIWLNPEPEGLWQYRQSIAIIRQLMSNRMFPVTIEGLERGMTMLSK
jgi:hypothetical protein